MTLHPNLEPLAGLVGLWRGTGRGHYPTIPDFAYLDEWEFSHSGKPFLSFVERTRHPETGAPMHTEAGYLRAPEPGVWEIVAALPTGQVELGGGRLEASAGVVTIQTDADVHRTPAAKQVDRIVRIFSLDGDSLDYVMSMAAVGQGLTGHLRASLTRA